MARKFRQSMARDCVEHGVYLGETEVDLTRHPIYSTYKPRDWALLLIGMYGGIDGSHHKSWVLDQVSRLLHGAPIVAMEARWSNGHCEMRFIVGEPTMEYHAWVADIKSGEDGTETHGYQTGIAP